MVFMRQTQMIKYKKNIFKSLFDKILSKIFRKKEKAEKLEINSLSNSQNNLNNLTNETLRDRLKINENNTEISNRIIYENKKSKSNYTELRKALTEVKIVLTGYDDSIVNRIPKKFINYINENCDKQYVPNINPQININEQKLLRKTRVILAIIYRKYLVNS